MKENLNVINATDFVGFVNIMNKYKSAEAILSRFFPTRQVAGLEYSYIKTSKGAVELSYVSAYDAEPIAQNRESFDAMKGELPLFRRKMSLSEKEEASLMQAMAIGNSTLVGNVVENIYDDKYTLVEGALWTQEYMRASALMNGEIVMKSAGGAVGINYMVPAENKYVLTGTDAWTDPSAKILDQIKEWIENVEIETGVKPDTMLLNRNTFKHFMNNTQVINNLLPISILVNATVAGTLALGESQVAESIKAFTGLKEIIVYNKKVQIENSLLDLVPDNKVAIFPGQTMGNTLIGTSPAELSVYKYGNDAVELTADGIAVAMVMPNGKGAPYTTETQIEFVCIPSLMGSDFLVLATVA